ncbi:MAG: hypothetical protein AB7V13_07545 [Pseudorhodoplanes sp.]|uniref:hypothetical protein n=1 Tax=Pseudorhodoplanes sp. TaxID=1934341 RepID=UPI003D14CA4C
MPRRKSATKRKSRGTSGGFCSTPAQRAAQARIEADEDEDNRALSNAFAFWRVCPKPRCRRMRTCAGVRDCFSDKWRQVHPDARFIARETMLAGSEGAGAKRAAEIAQHKLAERDALFARFDAAGADRRSQNQERAKPVQPRLRRL